MLDSAVLTSNFKNGRSEWSETRLSQNRMTPSSQPTAHNACRGCTTIDVPDANES